MLQQFLKRFKQVFRQVDSIDQYLHNDLKSPKVIMGQILARMNEAKKSIGNLDEVEFQVFSQWGDDGILQYILSKIDVPNKTFVEFGVENYRESNTRLLLVNNKWHGLVIDGSDKNISFIKNDVIYWATHLHARATFITKDNINEIIQSDLLDKGYDREIGLLSIDIDGNDYWVWDAINVIEPIIVVAEYNALFGYNKRWTLPYNAAFVRKQNGLPQSYWGVSLAALYTLADSKGYIYIGCNSNGNNAYFIRKDKMNDSLPRKTPEEGYVDSVFRELSVDGHRPSGVERIEALKGLDVFDLDLGKIIQIDPSDVRTK